MSVVIVTVLAIVSGIIYKFIDKSDSTDKTMLNKTSNKFQPTINFFAPTEQAGNTRNRFEQVTDVDSLDARKKLTKILFVDDDSKFKVIEILKKAGWINTRLVKDVDNVDDHFIKEIDIFFVDIQGVGKALQCKDEGLGLALILKRKYPKKKIVIYSAETKGDRFHKALRQANAFLAKNAEPYEFQELVEQFSQELYPNA